MSETLDNQIKYILCIVRTQEAQRLQLSANEAKKTALEAKKFAVETKGEALKVSVKVI